MDLLRGYLVSGFGLTEMGFGVLGEKRGLSSVSGLRGCMVSPSGLVWVRSWGLRWPCRWLLGAKGILFPAASLVPVPTTTFKYSGLGGCCQAGGSLLSVWFSRTG